MGDKSFYSLMNQAMLGKTAFVLESVNKDLLRMTDKSGNGLLHKTCIFGHLDLIQGLVEKGADINAKDKYGWDALYFASYHNQIPVAKYLLDHGADPCTRGERFTALGAAACEGSQEMCELLLSYGADLMAKMRGYGAVANRTAFDMYGSFASRLSEEKKKQGRQSLLEAFEKSKNASTGK